MSDRKSMKMTLADGTLFMLEWPVSISTEDLEFVEEAIAIQLRSIRRTIERRKGVENPPPLDLPEQTASASAQPARQDQQAAEQSVIACARRVLSKFGADSDWSEWKDLADALREFDSAGQDQQSAQRASVETGEFIHLMNLYIALSTAPNEKFDVTIAHIAWKNLIAHINAWGSAGSAAVDDALEAAARICEVRAEHWQQIDGTYAAGKKDGAFECAENIRFAKQSAASSPAPQGEQAMSNTQEKA